MTSTANWRACTCGDPELRKDQVGERTWHHVCVKCEAVVMIDEIEEFDWDVFLRLRWSEGDDGKA